MHDEMKKPELSEICQIEKDLIAALRTVVSHGVMSKDVDGKELGELVDMVKDMAETKRNCWEACYYQTVTEAMEEYDDEDSMGYNPNRYASGRYAPSGRGSRMRGFMPSPNGKMMDTKRGAEDWYPGMDYVEGPMGYPRRWMPEYMNENDPDRQYGEAFKEYKDARRHYTETHSMEDKSHMDQKAMEHVNRSMMTLREIWKSADPAVKKEVSSSIASLAAEFKNV